MIRFLLGHDEGGRGHTTIKFSRREGVRNQWIERSEDGRGHRLVLLRLGNSNLVLPSEKPKHHEIVPSLTFFSKLSKNAFFGESEFPK